MQTDIADGARLTVSSTDDVTLSPMNSNAWESPALGITFRWQTACHEGARTRSRSTAKKRALVAIDPSRQVEILIRIGSGNAIHRPTPAQRPRRASPIAVERLRSRRISRAALRPGLPETPPPGWVPAPHM